MFFFETVNTILFSVFDKLIIVINISISSFFNLLFILFLQSDELILLIKFFENMIILRLFHWIVSFNFVVWALIFWFVIFVMFLIINFAQINDDNDVVFASTFDLDFSDTWDLFVIWIFDASSIFFEFEFNYAFEDLIEEFFDISIVIFKRARTCWFFSYSLINFVSFCFMAFSNCWKFSDIVSQYEINLCDFFVKLIDANSKFFCLYLINNDRCLVYQIEICSCSFDLIDQLLYNDIFNLRDLKMFEQSFVCIFQCLVNW